MAWEELKAELSALKVRVEFSDPLWRVTGQQGSFRAHPAFLDSLRLTRELAKVVTGAADVLRQHRIASDNDLAQVPAARATLGLAAGRYDEVPEQIRILMHYRSIINQGAVLGHPEVLAHAAAFADSRHPATAAEFLQAQAAFVAAVQSLKIRYEPNEHRPLAVGLCNMALTAAAGAQPQATGQDTAWMTFRPAFVTTVQAQVAQLNFGSEIALAGHALKHISIDKNPPPADQPAMNRLILAYLEEARKRVIDTDPATVTSALDQSAGTRTYYFGTVGQHAAMVAVNSTGLAWISTYYAPGRI